MRRLSKYIGRFSVLLFIAATSAPMLAQQKAGLNQAQAVKIAERFVSKHKYSDESRSDSIMSRAVIARIETADGQSFWSVQFLFQSQPLEREYDFGREVKVSLDGRRASMVKKAIPVWKARIMGDCLGDELGKTKPSP